MMQHTKEYTDTTDPTKLRVKEFKVRALSQFSESSTAT